MSSDNENQQKVLIRLFDLVTPEKVFRQIKLNETEQKLQSLLIDTRSNNVSFDDIKPEAEKHRDAVEINYISSPENQNKKHGWISFKNVGNKTLPYLERAYRDNTSLDLFFNAIPTFELSRLVPYLNVKFLLSDNGNIESRKRHPSLQNFLDLYSTIAKGETTNKLNSAQVENLGNVYNGIITPKTGSYYMTDMSIFNSSALVNDRSKFKTDTSRPFMSIEKLEVSVDASKDFSVKYDIFNLSLVLHDRRNLELVADIFAPQLISDNKVYIEYGWSHPYDTATNVYAEFFNSKLRKKTICGIIASTYTFDEFGQVKINIKMQTLGSQHFFITNISESSYINSKLKAIESRQQIRKILNQLDTPKVTRGEQLLYGIADGSVDQISQETDKILLALLKSLDDSIKKSNTTTTTTTPGVKSVADLKKEYENFKRFTDDSETKKAASSHISKLFTDFSKEYEVKVNQKSLARPRDNGDVKLSHLIDHFVSKTLLSKGIANEIQVIYYSFNEHASILKNTTIADFPLYISQVEKIFKDKCESTKLIDITLEDFIITIARNFLNDPKTPAFGFIKSSTNIFADDPQIRKAANEKAQKEVTTIINNKDIEFKTPNVNFRVEFIPGNVSVYRIHIFDTARVAGYDPVLHYSDSLRALSSTFKAESTKPISSEVEEARKKFRRSVNELNIPKSFSEIKDNLKTIYPKLSLGKQSSVIKNFTLSNNLDPLTATGLMQNKISTTQFKGIAGTPRTNDNNIPFLRVIPGKISMQTLGFPLADIHQSFFADFDTNTDIDNVYTITKVTHTISPGNFITNFELSTSDNYASYINLNKELNKLQESLDGIILPEIKL